MMKNTVLFLSTFFSFILSAAPLIISGPTPTCGFPLVRSKTGEIIIKSRLEKPMAGDTTFFIYEDITASTPTMIEVSFKKLKEEGSVVVYVELAEYDGGRVTFDDAGHIIDALLYETPPGSVNPSKGILANEIDIFGEIPDVDNNGKLLVLLTNIRDNYDEEENPVYVAGYFDPRDQISGSGNGNFGDIMYIDTNPAKMYDENTLAIVAHELQHLIHYGVDDDESTWLNEGMSEFAMFILGFDSRSYGTFLRETNRSLTSFDNSIADYAKVGLWTLYCYTQFGLEFIKDVHGEISNSLDSYGRVLASHGLTIDTDRLMRNWFVANLINDSNIDDGVYGYGDIQISEVHSDYFYGSFPAGDEIDLSVKNSAAQYIQFFAGKNLRFNLDFTVDLDFKMAIVKEGSEPSVEFVNLSSRPYYYDDPLFGISCSKLTFIPYWTKISTLDKKKNISFSAQIVGGVEETEIVYDNKLTYYIQLNYAKAAEKFTASYGASYRLAGVKFNAAGDASITIRIFEYLNQYPTVKYDIVPSPGEWTSFYLPDAVPIPASKDIFVSVGSYDRNQSMGYSETRAGAGRAFLDRGSGYDDLNIYALADGSSLDGDWMIGAILHTDIEVDPDIEVSPPILYFWENEYSKQFELRNLGSGSINWHIISLIPDWMTLSLTEGSSLLALQRVNVSVNRNILNPGLYNQLLEIESSAGLDSVLISVMERNLYASQTGLFFNDLDFSNSVIKKSMKVINIGNNDGEFILKSTEDALVFYPDRGRVATTDTISVDVLIDSENIQTSQIPFSFFNGIDTLDYVFSFTDSLNVPDKSLKLFPVIPNPYITSNGGLVQIRFRCTDVSRATLQIFNIRGEQVQYLKINNPETGLHIYAWDGKNRNGHRVSSGVYFITLQQRNKTTTQKMLLLN